MIHIPKTDQSFLTASQLQDDKYYQLIDPDSPGHPQRILYVSRTYEPAYNRDLEGVIFEEGKEKLVPLKYYSWKRAHYKPVRRPILEVTFEAIS